MARVRGSPLSRTCLFAAVKSISVSILGQYAQLLPFEWSRETCETSQIYLNTALLIFLKDLFSDATEPRHCIQPETLIPHVSFTIHVQHC